MLNENQVNEELEFISARTQLENIHFITDIKLALAMGDIKLIKKSLFWLAGHEDTRAYDETILSNRIRKLANSFN